MTRKDVCKAAGLTVKTLRLYEEKGLIAPAREYRNGREYREYTPELVEQLQRIVTLRRAMFTMEEIREMQTQPERIPEIFADYQQWLTAQERQFRQLRQAADRIDGQSLESLDSLLKELSPAADQLPLPALDRKPNFRRLDLLEEPPRHVQAQTDFDETVPSDRVLRQMNLALGRNKQDKINLAFGQLDATRQALSGQEGGGPVQAEVRQPLALRILGGILTIAAVLLLLLGLKNWDAMLLELGAAALLLRLLLAGIPIWRRHRAWLRENSLATQESRQAQRRQRRKWIILGTSGGVLAIALVAALGWFINRSDHPDTDYRVCLVSPNAVTDGDLQKIEQVLAPLAGDLDGNGKEVTAVDLLLGRNDSFISTDQGDLRPAEYLEAAMTAGADYTLYLIADVDVWYYSVPDSLDYAACCRELPADLQSEESPYLADLTGTAVFQAADLGALTVYGCIAAGASDQEYDQAVALLRQMLGR
jgi:DNA-binding transcriptional MerR regulator